MAETDEERYPDLFADSITLSAGPFAFILTLHLTDPTLTDTPNPQRIVGRVRMSPSLAEALTRILAEATKAKGNKQRQRWWRRKMVVTSVRFRQFTTLPNETAAPLSAVNRPAIEYAAIMTEDEEDRVALEAAAEAYRGIDWRTISKPLG